MSFEEFFNSLPALEQQIIRRMRGLFEAVDQQTKKFADETKLKCREGCGACCENPDVETTVAEVLPLALYLWATGEAESKLDLIRSKSINTSCVFYKPDTFVKGHGRCSIYSYRPGICRLFGFSARRDKHGDPQLMTCKPIKSDQQTQCHKAVEKLKAGMQAPFLGNHALSVADIDPVQGQKFFPINQAIALGIEKIGYSLQKVKQ